MDQLFGLQHRSRTDTVITSSVLLSLNHDLFAILDIETRLCTQSGCAV